MGNFNPKTGYATQHGKFADIRCSTTAATATTATTEPATTTPGKATTSIVATTPGKVTATPGKATTTPGKVTTPMFRVVVTDSSQTFPLLGHAVVASVIAGLLIVG